MVAGGFRVLICCLQKTPKADQKIPFRVMVTPVLIFLLIILLFTHIPLYGIHSTTGPDPDPDPDPLFWIRVFLVSERGTFMELGISPVVTYVLVMQILVHSEIIGADYNHRALISIIDRQLLGLVIAFGQALAYVGVFGMFGDADKLGAANATLVTIQLGCFGLVVFWLDEILRSGYFGTGIAPLPPRVPFVPGRQWGRRLGVPLEPNEFARALERIRIRQKRYRAARGRPSREGPVPEGSTGNFFRISVTDVLDGFFFSNFTD